MSTMKELDFPGKEREFLSILSTPTQKSFFDMISWFDKTIYWRYYNGKDEEDEVTLFLETLLARAVIIHGKMLKEKKLEGPNMDNTMAAAEKFIKEPIEQNLDLFKEAATNSFPFGPGDGCFRIKETGAEECTPGSGCFSGIGCLYFHGDRIDLNVLMKRISNELIPLIQERFTDSQNKSRFSGD